MGAWLTIPGPLPVMSTVKMPGMAGIEPTFIGADSPAALRTVTGKNEVTRSNGACALICVGDT